jgi:site-specific DNA-methyltransferase (adenine-specific)
MLLLPERSVTTLDTVHCCDCFTLMNQLADASVDAIITDMPYGTTVCTWDTRVDFDRWWAAVKRVLKPRGVMVTTASQPFTSMLVMSNLEWFRYEWIWDKVIPGNFGNAKRQPLRRHENILVFATSEPNYSPQLNPELVGSPFGKRSPSLPGAYGNFGTDYQIKVGYPQSIIREMRPNNLTGGCLHPTQKPVALYEYLIRTYTQPGDVILDPFMGSGTTAVAARNLDRHYIGCDVSPEYVNLARQRIQNSDPYQASILPTGETQLSLFEATT